MPDERARGVENPGVVDLIHHDRDTGEVVLTLLERRPWGSSPEQIRQLEDKINAYLSYVCLGHLVRDYEQYAELKVRIQLDCAEAPRPEERRFLEAARQYIAGEGIRFVVSVVPAASFDLPELADSDSTRA